MTLVCACGSPALEFEDQHYPDDGMARETYRCADCGDTGTFRFGNGTQQMSGCVTENGDY